MGNFDLSWFLTVPGMFITGGVLLLVVALIILLVTGKKAVLEYRVLDYDLENNCSLVSILLKTGRHHQIRVQFASRGHYLLGDQRYGVLDNKQISLFAYSLTFTHPVTKTVLHFEVRVHKKLPKSLLCLIPYTDS